MRLGELVGCDVVDVDGDAVGRVHEVRLARTGPPQGSFGPALVVHSLVVGRAGIAERLGYGHGRLDRPWLVAAIARVLARPSVVVPWAMVASIDGATIALDVAGDQLDPALERGGRGGEPERSGAPS